MKLLAPVVCTILFLGASLTAAWTPPPSLPCRRTGSTTASNDSKLFSHDDSDNQNDKQIISNPRRVLLQSLALPLLTLPAHAADPLDQLGEALSNAPSSGSNNAAAPPPPPLRWPETSVSPLYPPVGNNNSSSSSNAPPSQLNLEQTLEGLQKKRQIDPRTHG